MSKKFWKDCFKKFFLITIPTLVAIITIFTCFSYKFENLLKEFGIWGAIIICLLCFSITLLSQTNEIIHFVDFMGNEILEDLDYDNSTIYNFYTIYHLPKKKSLKTKEININLYKSQKFYNKYLTIKDFFNDMLQEISYIALAHGFNEMSCILHSVLANDVPKLLDNANIVQLRKNISDKFIYNVFINFYGVIESTILLCFYDQFHEIAYNIIKEIYPNSNHNYDKFISSFLFELGSIFTATCLTQFHSLCPKLGKLSWDENNKKVINFEIKTNININELQPHNYTRNIYSVKLQGQSNKTDLLTSYIIFDKDNAKKLVDGFSKVAFRIL